MEKKFGKYGGFQDAAIAMSDALWAIAQAKTLKKKEELKRDFDALLCDAPGYEKPSGEEVADAVAESVREGRNRITFFSSNPLERAKEVSAILDAAEVKTFTLEGALKPSVLVALDDLQWKMDGFRVEYDLGQHRLRYGVYFVKKG